MQKQSQMHCLEKKLTEQGQKIHTAEAGIDIGREGKKNNTDDQMTVTAVTQSDDEGRKEICPMCKNSVEYGICCDLCQQWYHFECETLSEDDIERFQDTDLQYNCISCTYDTQCESINDSVLYTRSGVTEIGEETYLKTLDGDINHLNTQTPTEAYKTRHNETMILTDPGAEVKGAKQIQTKGTSFDQNCDSGTETLMENAKPHDRVVDYSHDLGKSKKSQMSETSDGVGNKDGLVNRTSIGGAIIGGPGGSVSNGYYPNAGSPEVQPREVPETEVVHEKQAKKRKGSRDTDCNDTEATAPRDGKSKGSLDAQGETHSKGVKPAGKQNKRVDKSKLKEEEHEEQLNLARSLISNLERKVGELQDTNQILRQGLITGSTSGNQNNNIHVQGEQSFSNSIGRDPSIRENIANGGTPYSSIEKDIMILKESLRGLEMEHMRARIQNMEQSMQIQSQLNALHTCTSRNTGYIPTNPHCLGTPGSVLWPGSHHTFYGHHPYYPHTFPNQGIQTIPNSHLYLNAYMSNAANYPSVAPIVTRYITPQPFQATGFSNPIQSGYPIYYQAQQQAPGSRHGASQQGHGLQNGTRDSRGMGQPCNNQGEQRPHQQMVNPAPPHQVVNPAPPHQQVVNPAPVHNSIDSNEGSTSMFSTQTQNDKTPKVDSPKSMHDEENRYEGEPAAKVQKGESCVQPQMRSGAQSQGEKSFNRDKDTLIPASPIHHQNEDITPELETKERNNKPFLGMGRASETTAKRRSL